MPLSTHYVACYDVTDDHERERVAKVLEGFGLRVQKSVFECRLTRSGRERLLAGVEKLQLQTGFLYLYKLPPGGKRYDAGTLPPNPFAEERFSFVV